MSDQAVRDRAVSDLVERVLGHRGGPVVVVGDLLLDRWVTGTAHRLSREAPAAVVQVSDRDAAPGGAANTAVNLAALGRGVRLVGAVGTDASGTALLELLTRAGVDTAGVVRSDDAPTTVKTRVSAAGQLLLRVDEGAPLDDDAAGRVAERLEEALAGASAVLVCDYGMGAAGAPVQQVLATLRRSGPLVVDAHDLEPWARVRPDVVTPNAAEAERLLGRGLGVDRVRGAREAGGELRARADAAGVVVTLDLDGTVVHTADAATRTTTTAAPEANANGAGDTFAAALTLALAAGLDLHAAARFGQLAAEVVVRTPGTGVCTAAELRAAIASPDGDLTSTGGARLLDEAELLAALAAERAAGRRIVFTNGCFDVLHRGHTAYLKQARALGDLLVVAVNDDDSTRRLKGPGRPVNPAADRAGVLAELASVDYVTVFAADTAVHLIEAIEPDVYAKGGDYLPGMLVETPVVEAHGGRVQIVDYVSPHSTSEIIARARSAGSARG